MIVRHQLSESIFQMITSILAIITNTMLFILIKFKSPPSLGGYKYLMMYIALFEIFYAFFDFVFLPYIYSAASGCIIILDPIVISFHIDILQVFDFMFAGFLGMAMAIFGIHFVYRYLVVSGNKTWTSTSPFRVAVWISIPVVVFLLWVAASVAFLGKNSMSDGFMNYELQAEIAYVGPFFDYRLSTEDNMHVYYGLGCIFAIGFCCFSVMIYSGFKCHFEVRALVKDSTKSYTYKSLQAQLFYVLVAQSMIPFLLVFCPACVLCISVYFNFSHPYFGKVLTLTNAIYPVFDPLPNMLMIRNYRTALMFWKERFKDRRNAIVPTHVLTQKDNSSVIN